MHSRISRMPCWRCDVRADRRLSLLWFTLLRCAYTLCAFFAAWALLVAGFALFAQLSFGHLVADFHSWQSSFSKLLRYPLGDFSYYQLLTARPDGDVAALFFAIYMALVYLVRKCMPFRVVLVDTCACTRSHNSTLFLARFA